MKDPALLAETEKANLQISPTPHEAVQAAIAELAATPSQHLDIRRDLQKDHK